MRYFVKPGEAASPDLAASAAETIQTIQTIDTSSAKGIGETPEGKRLAGMILRHQGKRRWKYSPAERKLIVDLSETFGSKAVHDAFGIAYDTVSRLKKRYTEDSDRKPRVPLKYMPVLDLMHKHPGMGPMQMRDYIRRHMGLNMGVNSIRRIMEQNGWVPPYARSTRIKEATRHFEAIRKNFLWHADFKHHYINQSRVAILFFQDDYSRFLVGHSFSDSENIDTVVQVMEDAIAVHGKPESIMSDGGSAFYSWRGVSQFTKSLEDHGIDHYIAKSANVNGKIESVCCQVEKELLNVQTFSSLAHFQKELAQWVGFYNFKRPHQGIGDGHVPADRFYPGAAHWFSTASETTKQQSLIAETMMTLLSELKRGS
jgi:putative transposase